jgi:hypothetical protein
MASPTYTQVLKVMSDYVGQEKAEGALNRQLEKAGTSPDALDPATLKNILSKIQGVATLYIEDEGKQKEVEAKLAAIAG